MTDAQLAAILHSLREGLARVLGARLHRVLLYGSRARGEARDDSDIDVLVVVDVVVLEDVLVVVVLVEVEVEVVAAMSLPFWDIPNLLLTPPIIVLKVAFKALNTSLGFCWKVETFLFTPPLKSGISYLISSAIVYQ